MLAFNITEELAMTKHTSNPREQQQREAEQSQQNATKNQHSAEEKEVAGSHRNDGQKDHKGADKGPRGQ